MSGKKPTRDKTKYHYFTVGIDVENTELLERLEQDRKRMGLRYISQVIAVRTNDYYELKDSISHMSMSHGSSQQTEESSDEFEEMIAEQERLNQTD